MKNFVKKISTGIILYGFFILFFLWLKPIFTSAFLIAILFLIMILEWPRICKNNSKFWLLTPFYPLFPFILLIYMSSFYNYRLLLFYMILITTTHDTGGYLVGYLMGKHKLAKNISPKKTWEGFFGGCLFTFLTTYSIFKIVGSNASVWIALAISFSISILATLGDLFESWAKRKAGIKDSGNILPAHGGFLDRFDSILFVTILFFVFKNYLVEVFRIIWKKLPFQKIY